MKKHKVTITDVSERAGVSPTAVSFAFNKPDLLSEATLQRIRDASAELGYKPNPVARALNNQKLNVIGVMAPQNIETVFADPYYCEFLRGIGNACDTHHLDLLTLSPMHGTLEGALSRAMVDGFIVNGISDNREELAFLRKQGRPFVIVDSAAEFSYSINIDDESGAYAAAKHMLTNGHTDILIVRFDTRETENVEFYEGVSARRIAGYRRAFVEAGAIWRDERIVAANTLEGGQRAFEAVLAHSNRPPTAVLTLSDALALGVLRAAEKAHLSVPRDLEVIGFNDLSLDKMARARLSTVYQPIFEKGKRAVEALLAAMTRSDLRKQIILSTELMLRETTRA